MLRVLNHPEQQRNVALINNLLDRLDRAGHNPGDACPRPPLLASGAVTMTVASVPTPIVVRNGS